MITDLLKVFNIQNKDDSGAGKVAGTVGLWFLHLCKLTLLIYTATHAINASWQYAGSSAPQKLFQMVGIVTVEIVLLGIYLAYINGMLSGWSQLIVAVFVYLTGFTIAGLGVLVDSQLNGNVLTPFSASYLQTGLPIAPLLMGFGAVVIAVLDPKKLQVAEMARKMGQLNRQQFDADIAMKTLDMQNNLATLALQVQGKQALIMEMANLTHSAEYKQAVKQRAITEATASYHQMGIELELPSPTLSIQPTTPSTTNTPPPHEELPSEEVVKETQERFQPSQPSLNGYNAHHNGSGPTE